MMAVASSACSILFAKPLLNVLVLLLLSSGGSVLNGPFNYVDGSRLSAIGWPILLNLEIAIFRSGYTNRESNYQHR